MPHIKFFSFIAFCFAAALFGQQARAEGECEQNYRTAPSAKDATIHGVSVGLHGMNIDAATAALKKKGLGEGWSLVKELAVKDITGEPFRMMIFVQKPTEKSRGIFPIIQISGKTDSAIIAVELPSQMSAPTIKDYFCSFMASVGLKGQSGRANAAKADESFAYATELIAMHNGDDKPLEKRFKRIQAEATQSNIAKAANGTDKVELIGGRPDPNLWFLIHSEGKKPSRVIYLGQEGFPRGSNRMNIEVINESTKKADSIYTKIRIDCAQKSYQQSMYSAIYRDGRHTQNDEVGAMQPVKEAWEEQAYRFVCGKGTDLTAANGFQSLGTLPDFKLVEYVWTVLWPDGTRPSYTTTKSREEALADLDKATTSLKKQLDDTRAKANASLEKTQSEMAQQADWYKRNQKRVKQMQRQNAVTPALATWLGATEQQVLQAWGNPAQVLVNGDARALVYRRGFEGADYIVQTPGVTYQAPGIVNYCDFQFEIVQGVVDYYRILRNDAGQCVREGANFPVGPGR